MTKSKNTNMEVRKKNRNRIYRYISQNGTVSNPDIAYQLKLSLPTVTQNTKELLDMGLIQDLGEMESTGGRKARALSAVQDYRLAVGLDITQNHIGLLLTNLAGEIRSYERISHPFHLEEEYFLKVNEKMEEFLEKLLIEEEKEKILGIGISFPGIVNLERQEITYSHILSVRNLPFSYIEKYFSYPCFFLNDANSGAYGEGIRATDKKGFFYLSLSNTVGGAYFSGGNLLYGTEFRCGEVGHMTLVPDGKPCYCGKRGCLDAYCAAGNLAQMAGGRLEKYFEELKQGNPEYRKAWETYRDYLAVAVNNIHMLLDCNIILGGYVGSYLGEYMEEIRQKVGERNIFSEEGEFVRECKYKIGAAAFGAALYVVEEFLEQI